jgi:hypothetical protein
VLEEEDMKDLKDMDSASGCIVYGVVGVTNLLAAKMAVSTTNDPTGPGDQIIDAEPNLYPLFNSELA